MAKNRIAVLRKILGLNQKELGEQLGVGQTTISAWETGRNEPDSSSLGKMAELFNASVGYILGLEPESFTRGLPMEQFQANIVKKMAQETEEQEIEELQRMAQEERCGLSEEEIEELIEDELIREWEASDLKGTYFEVYQFDKLCERLSKEERKRAIQIIQLAFPNAVRGKYTGEMGR